MKKINFLFIGILTAILFNSCDKCDASNYVSGFIVKDAKIKINSGGNVGQRFINVQPATGEKFQVSFDGGFTYELVDFTQYSVFALTTFVPCTSSGISRDVTVIPEEHRAVYTVTIAQCKSCDYGATLNNWVLTSKIPSDYQISYKVKKK